MLFTSARGIHTRRASSLASSEHMSCWTTDQLHLKTAGTDSQLDTEAMWR